MVSPRNVAVTWRAWLIVTVHCPVPLQAPLHPWKLDPCAAVAVSVTPVPWEKERVHCVVHGSRVGENVTWPSPKFPITGMPCVRWKLTVSA
jgi:hypothetical protein